MNFMNQQPGNHGPSSDPGQHQPTLLNACPMDCGEPGGSIPQIPFLRFHFLMESTVSLRRQNSNPTSILSSCENYSNYRFRDSPTHQSSNRQHKKSIHCWCIPCCWTTDSASSDTVASVSTMLTTDLKSWRCDSSAEARFHSSGPVFLQQG